MTTTKTYDELLEEIERLQYRLEESEAVVQAIQTGIVDAVVVATPGENVYTLEGADRPYRLLVEAMQQGVAVLNAEGVMLYGNTCLANLLRTSVGRITGCPVDDFVAEADQPLWTELLGYVGNSSASLEVRLCHHQDGTTFPAALTLSSLPLGKFCLLVTDLSQQKLYEELLVSKEALRHLELRYRRLFETAKDGILILDTESGRITDANPFMSELLGYSHDQFLNKELWEIGVISDKAANKDSVRKLKQTGYIRYEHLPLETNSGQRVEVEIVANAYQEDQHRVIQCNIRDITERNRLEKLMREQAVMLADLHRRKDEFLAMLSHELRNPLAPITNAVHLLSLQKNEDPLQHQARTIIERQVGQLTRLVDDLLEVSRISTGRIHLQQERVTLNGIVDQAVESCRTLINQRRHQLTVSLSPEPIWLYADAARLEQVVVNLLNNAAKYTVEGGQISVAIHREGDEAVLWVRDSGIGIAPELLPCIFDLFTQAERSLDRSQGGLGIGLCLVQRLTQMHGGRVEVYSTLGQGSEFVVHLPAMQTIAEPNSSSNKEAADPSESSLRVLVVDDNVDAAETLGLLLKAFGHDVRAAYDGLTGLETAIDFVPNVILLDIGLPGLDGFEVANRIRQRPELNDSLLIAMTGYGQPEDRLRSQAAGFDHHLVKPANFRDVQEILASVSEKII